MLLMEECFLSRATRGFYVDRRPLFVINRHHLTVVSAVSEIGIFTDLRDAFIWFLIDTASRLFGILEIIAVFKTMTLFESGGSYVFI